MSGNGIGPLIFTPVFLPMPNISAHTPSSFAEILGIGKKTGVKIKGPIPLPLKKLHIATRKSPCGSGTETYEKWEMRLHRRVIDINADDKAIRQLMRLKMPDDVQIELTLT